MEDILKQLLETETQAEAIVEQAKAAVRQHVDQAVLDGQTAERTFIDSIPALHNSLHQQAEQRAAQTLREIERRYQEHAANLREYSDQHRDAALQAALTIVLADG